LTERSKKIQRQLKRYLGGTDAEQQIGGETADGAILSQFPNFLDAIDKAYAEYEERLKIAARNIEISSKELTSAFSDLERLNVSINAMLDSLGQGLLFFDETGLCSPVYSQSCRALLGTDPAQKFLPDLLDWSPEQQNSFRTWLQLTFAGGSALDFDDMKALLPDEFINSGGLIIELDYRPMYVHEDRLMGILLIATDVTDRREAETRLSAMQQQSRKIQLVAQDRNGFLRFVTDFETLLAQTVAQLGAAITDRMREDFSRQLHTYKGFALTFGLENIASEIHKAEQVVQSAENESFNAAMADRITALRGVLAQEKEFSRGLFGPDYLNQGAVQTVDLKKLTALSDMLSGNLADARIAMQARNFLRREILAVPVFDMFLPFERELARLAEQEGKPVPHFILEGDNLPVLAEPYQAVFDALIHVARNIVDHGIEPGALRVRAGKPEYGTVRVELRGHTDAAGMGAAMTIVIHDDGRGIDPARIRARLSERGIDSLGEDDDSVIQHIFDDEVSLTEGLTLISGRGIGMGVLKQAVEDLGGSVEIRSRFAKQSGISLLINLPPPAG